MGHKAWNKGLTKNTDERVAKYSRSPIGHVGAFAGKKRPEHSKMMRGRKQTPEHIENRISLIRGVKRPWMTVRNGNIEFQKKCLKGSENRPTSYEKIVIKIIEKYDLAFSYCGDGELWIGQPPMNPDFVHRNKKICIEVYDDFHKRVHYKTSENYEKIRSENFKKYNWDCIFIDNKIIKNEEKILEKIGGYKNE